ncbi:MAG: GNAT family N-acetyltransferase [Bacteroidales bacterium]|jgi:ribosomal protein S18 acetylase RimI-like enzyme|nr:GNAT family N-acetyltransferase [Bacteroidales bacterium]
MLEYSIIDKSIGKDNVVEILTQYDSYFIPKISERNNLIEYAEKLASNATFIIAKKFNNIAGFAAFYFNQAPKSSYLTLIAVNKDFQGLGIGKSLINELILFCRTKNSTGIMLEMRANDSKLLNFYTKLGFEITEKFKSPFNEEVKYYMNLRISKNE